MSWLHPESFSFQSSPLLEKKEKQKSEERRGGSEDTRKGAFGNGFDPPALVSSFFFSPGSFFFVCLIFLPKRVGEECNGIFSTRCIAQRIAACSAAWTQKALFSCIYLHISIFLFPPPRHRFSCGAKMSRAHLPMSSKPLRPHFSL